MELEEWQVVLDGDKIHIDSMDFTHDARLMLSGDFEDRDSKLSYAHELAKKLNTRNQWIPVTERLPEHGIEVEIAYFDGLSMGRCFGAYIDDIDGWYKGGFKLEPTFNVTHWKGASALPLHPEE